MSASRDDDILRRAFDRYDSNGNGSLEFSEFELLVLCLGNSITEVKDADSDVIEAVFALLDTNSSGDITFDEFREWWLTPDRYSFFGKGKKELLVKAHTLYKSCVTSGGMTYHEFDTFADERGIAHTEYDFDNLDKDDDGLLSFSEFCAWLSWF